jgi:hypothetical protein
MSSTEKFPSQIPTDQIQSPAIAEALVRPQDTIESFTTSHDSVYTYDTDGYTTRFKTKTGVEQPKQDITVFVEVGVKDAGTIAAGYLLRSSTETTKIEVVEQQPDGSLKVVKNTQEITDPEQLQVVTFRGDRVIKSKPASLFPKIGLYVYDSRRFEEDGVTKTERHLGHKVSSILYKS